METNKKNIRGSEEVDENKILKVGDTIKIISYKFPELHPIKTFQKIAVKTLEELKIIYEKFPIKDGGAYFYKKDFFPYEIVEGFDYLGATARILKIDEEPRCEYELMTGDIAKYFVKITEYYSYLVGMKFYLYSSQVQKL